MSATIYQQITTLAMNNTDPLQNNQKAIEEFSCDCSP